MVIPNYLPALVGHKIISSGNVYTCGKYNTNGKKGCGASYFSVNCEWLEDKVLKEISKLFSDSVIEKTYEEFKKVYIESAGQGCFQLFSQRRLPARRLCGSCLPPGLHPSPPGYGGRIFPAPG